MSGPRATTPAERAILGLLAEEPRHGYEIEQVIRERGMREWTDIAFSSIYYVLGRLEKAGLVTTRRDKAPGRGPARTLHVPTRAGLDAWRADTLAALATPEHRRDPYLGALAGLAGLERTEITAALEARIAGLAAERTRIAARRAAQEPLPWFAGAIFDHALALLDAERAAVANLLATIPAAGEPEHAMPADTSAKRRTPKPFVPEIVTLPDRMMAVVHTAGDPNETGPRAFPALYGAVYGLRFARKKAGDAVFSVEPPCARWFAGPDWKSLPREAWTAAWAIPVPANAADLPQKDPATPVAIERWAYGTVAQILHVGPYADEEPTIETLHRFIDEAGLEISGPHEEVYLSRPGAKDQKTLIRYQVRQKDAG